jgi:hypothetical protein
MQYRVFESGSGKWIAKIDSLSKSDLQFASDTHQAELFSFETLKSAHEALYEFSIYKRTLHAVPTGTNYMPSECPTVANTIKEERQNRMGCD